MLPSAHRAVLCLLPACLWPAMGARAEVWTYPGPKGIAASKHYTVQVHQAGRTRDSFVYVSKAQWRSNRSKDTSWTTFSFSGQVTVRVTCRGGRPRSCRVLPSSYRIQPRLQGPTATFTLDKPRNVAVEFDRDITHPMLVFANPPEQDVPRRGGPKLLYFGPGVHDVGRGFVIPPGKDVYLAAGAYVKGTMTCRDPQGLRIRGRGILSGEQFPATSHHLLQIEGWKTRDTFIEGITFANSPHFNLRVSGRRHVIRNVKMIGWWFSTDGIGVGPDALVEDCFLKVNDDAIKLYHSRMTVRRCVIWQGENGAPFQISWNMPSDNSDFHVSDCDVIRCEHRWKNDNCAIFCSIHGGPGHMRGYRFENIRIENAPWRLVNLVMKKTRFAPKDKPFGRISDVVFRHITVDGAMTMPNTIAGADGQHRIENIRFENVRVNGRVLDSAKAGRFQIDPGTTRSITFRK